MTLRRRYQLGDSISALARWAGVSWRTVHLALTGETHAHVGGPLREISDRRRPLPLSATDRETVVMLWCEGRDMREIAAHFGRSDYRLIRRVLRDHARTMRQALDEAMVPLPGPPSYRGWRGRRPAGGRP